MRLAGIWLLPVGSSGSRIHAAAPAVTVRPVTGSPAPAAISRVVAGSKIVPSGNVRPSRSVRVPPWSRIKSDMSVKLLCCMRAVGAVRIEVIAWLATVPS